ncbi:hypothetical protein Tsubulata_007599 [Turnera subulata]|uniref:RING-type E3 ubiquitin transferase n=1 Tax=Turnera subulata TaxID=218843 RepID=A0A9Q0JHU4_9ROSI|nr:hypothetical protein Tsubulata_007599 [Turnera subulata]
MAKFSVDGGDDDGEESSHHHHNLTSRTRSRPDHQGMNHPDEDAHHYSRHRPRRRLLDGRLEGGSRRSVAAPSAGADDGATGFGENGSPLVTLIDTDVLDCPICCEPFTAPVFQCENGHTACCSCCRKLAGKCPSCSLPIGYNRCRAIEKVIRVATIPCHNSMYGCKERVRYSKKYDHEKTCIYAPCVCPIPGCNFISSFQRLYQHSNREHSGSVTQFHFKVPFNIRFTAQDNFHVLQEVDEGVLFIMNNKLEPNGNAITVSCIKPSSFKGEYSYDVAAKLGASILNFQSVITNTLARSDSPPSAGFLLVPKEFFDSDGGTTLELCISKR